MAEKEMSLMCVTGRGLSGLELVCLLYRQPCRQVSACGSCFMTSVKTRAETWCLKKHVLCVSMF